MGDRVYLTDLIQAISTDTGLPLKTIKQVVESYHENVEDIVADGHTVQITNHGIFGSRFRQGREFRNPQTQEKTHTQDKYVPYFKPGSRFKILVDESAE